jgi:hypothetical protein
MLPDLVYKELLKKSMENGWWFLDACFRMLDIGWLKLGAPFVTGRPFCGVGVKVNGILISQLFRSITGDPENASMSSISMILLLTEIILHRLTPIRLGRTGEWVAKTPVKGFFLFPRG